ncbi:uncharacterized protein LOC116348224 [Contarinia nasturtii]|uniref:uncharacterized protein LOC116348224 n=1 Tax=Contarinia nasturtii TaxID=265458 RepID=UPI0012D47614|nr:uncharacterized protein LOC116348224 [Contarinia nasturtii]
MPFICDDINWRYVDEEDQYDKSRYVVVRKLHITLNTGPWQVLELSQFTPDEIRRRLRKFGDIESIDMLSSIEADVTFVCDRNAYLAQLQQDYDIQIRRQRPFRIRPADTWNQPQDVSTEPIDESVQTSEIFNLNEDCLLYLFRFLDLDSQVHLSEVCKLFAQLLHKHCFPRVRYFSVENDGHNIQMPLAKMRRTLRCIGAHITDLKYTCNIYNDVQSMMRFVEVLAQFVGPNLRRAQFLNSLICMGKQISTLAPILRNLESLEIYDSLHDCYDDIDFEEICPNLTELKLKLNMRLEKCCKPWRQLQHLSVLSNEFLNTITFVDFLEQNPRLKTIEFDVFESDVKLGAIGKHLPMLEKLTMDSIDVSLGPWDFQHIAALQLTEINLMTLNYEHLSGFFDCLSTFTRLRKIDFHATRPLAEEDDEKDYERSLVNMVKSLPELEEFSLRSVSITEKTLLEFLRSAQQLKIIHTHWCLLKFSDILILDIVGILKCIRPNKNLLFYVDPADYICIRVTRNEDVKQYLSISSKCQHLGF